MDRKRRVDLATVAVVAPKHAMLERRATAELEELTPPPAIAMSWKAILADRRALTDDLQKAGEAASAGMPGLPQVEALGALKTRVRQHMYALGIQAGFQNCAILGRPVKGGQGASHGSTRGGGLPS